MTMNEKQVDKILTADELRQQKEQAEILEAQRTHEEQSSWFSFMSLHCGVKGVYGDGTGLPNVDRLVHDCAANRRLLLAQVAANGDIVSPATLERAWLELKDTGKLAPLPKSINPENKSGERISQNGNRTNAVVDQESRQIYEYRNQKPTPPHTKMQLLGWAGKVKGQPADLDSFRKAVKNYGSDAINRILNS
jgi:hypothetical protein